MNNPYLDLTEELNQGRLRAILSSGQAVVLYRLAVMSKDGDWILREDEETVAHVLHVLSRHGARYRFGAPLDLRWLAGGWSAHLEFRRQSLRLRCDFVTRPPRLSEDDLARLWQEPVVREAPTVSPQQLAEIKKTNREKDYAVIGELARIMPDPRSQLLYSRSARDLIELADAHPTLVAELTPQRPLLATLAEGREELERALDAERRTMMRTNEERLARYQAAARRWSSIWPEVQRQITGLPLGDAHAVMTARAEGVLPYAPQPDSRS